MLVCQAAAASELFTGEKIDNALSEQVINEMYRRFRNIVLVGMPGSGKTTAGRDLAGKMERDFIDIDECIVKKAGLTILEIFEQQGEEKFRVLERDCVTDIAKSVGLVIATGGGIILDGRNMRSLMRNSRVYYLNRDIHNLPTDGRPLSNGEHALEMLYQKRHPLYIEYSDVCVNNNDTVDDTVKTIMGDFNEAIGN